MDTRSRIGIVALLLAASAGLSAQEVTGTITGTVRDRKGQPLGGVSLKLTSVGGVQSRSLSTDNQGAYRVPLLLPGEYTLTATKDGYITAKAEFRVTGGGVVRQDIDLSSVNTSTAIVEVVSTAAQVDKTQTKTVASFTQESFAEIPLSGNYPTRALAGLSLAPGVTQVGSATGAGALYPSIRGGGQGQTQFMVNGLSVRDNITMQGRPQDVILDDLIEESQIILSPLNAKYGDSSAGLVNIVEKTGGNEFAGSIRVKLDRPTWTALRPAAYTRAGLVANSGQGASVDDLSKTYEIAISGPLIKDRLTFTYGTRLQPTALVSATAGNLGANTFTWYKGSAAAGAPALANTRADGTVFSGPQRFTFHQGRLYWQINTDQSLDYSHAENTSKFFDFNGGNFPTVEPATNVDTNQYSINRFRQITYRGIFGGNNIVEARYGKRESTIKFAAGPGDPIFLWFGPSNISSLNNASIQRGVNGAGADSQPELRNTESASINWNTYLDAAGTHNIDVGVNYVKTIWGTVQNSGGPNGLVAFIPGQLRNDPATGLPYNDNTLGYIVFPWNSLPPNSVNRIPTLQQFLGVQQASLQKPTKSYYANDLWTLNNHWSWMFGVRYEKWNYSDGLGRGYRSSAASPRTEVKFDLGGDGKRVFNFSYGEFRGNVGERITRQQSVYRRSTVVTRYWDQASPNGANTTYTANQAAVLNPASYGYIVAIDDPGAIYGFQGDFRPERDKEYTLGYRRAYTSGGYLSLTFVHRKWDDLPQSIGDPAVVTVHDPNGGPATFANYFRKLVNDPNAKREYNGVEADFRLPLLQGRANVMGSYTYARLVANNNYGDSTGFGLTQTQAIAGLFRTQLNGMGVSSDAFEPVGQLPTSIGQTLRLLTTYAVRRGETSTTFSLAGRYQKGAPESQVVNVYIPGSDPNTGYSTLNPSFPTAFVLPSTYGYYYGGRGQFTAPDTLFWDFGMQFQVPLSKKVNSFVEVQVVNVFNHLYPVTLNRTSNGNNQPTPTGYLVNSANTFGYPTANTSFDGARDINLNFGIRF